MDLEELQEALKGVETKAVGAVAPAVTAAMAPVLERLDAMEAKANRPATEGKATGELTPEHQGVSGLPEVRRPRPRKPS